jgi:hypothetical protein
MAGYNIIISEGQTFLLGKNVESIGGNPRFLWRGAKVKAGATDPTLTSAGM